jgi:hypothetical protein
MPLAKGVARESVSTTGTVSSTATAPNKANTLRFMSPSPDLLWSNQFNALIKGGNPQ